jgi:hypothetical protein
LLKSPYEYLIERRNLAGAAAVHFTSDEEMRLAQLAGWRFKGVVIPLCVEIPQGGAEGMLVTDGGHFGGYGFYPLKGGPVFTWNLLQLALVKWKGNEALTPG